MICVLIYAIAFFIGGEYINKRILLISLFLIFFICVQSAAAVSDVDYTSIHSQNLLTSDSGSNLDDSSSGLSSKEIYSKELSLSDSSIGHDNGLGESSSSNDSQDLDLSNSTDSLDENSNSSSDISDSSATKDISNGNGTDLNSTNETNVIQKPQLIVIPDNSSLNSAYIQKIIDNATPGSTIQFAGSFYKNLNLKINKPLNIISKSGTVINMTYSLPVFTILKGGSGTNISGFTANIADSFVEAKDVSNIGISKNKIFTKRTAIILENVYDSKINNNQFLRFNTAIDISKSGGIVISKNNITPDSSGNIGINLKDIDNKNKISILNNRIIGFNSRIESTGIYFGTNARNVLIQGNAINNWYTAIDFPNSFSNVSIINNTIRDNGDGLLINNGVSNFTFRQNLVTNNGRYGILFDYDFTGVKGNLSIEKNYFSDNGHLDMKSAGQYTVTVGENFAARRCVKILMSKGYSIKTRQNGNSYVFTIVDKNGRYVGGLPNFNSKISINGVNYNVFFVDSMAYLEAGNGTGEGDAVLDVGEDKRSLNDWGETQTVNSDDMRYYKDYYQQLIDALMGNQDSDDDSQDDEQNAKYENGTGSAYSNGNGGGDSGISDGSSSVSSSGNSAGSSGSSSVSPSSASAGGASPSASESVTAKSLSLDEETFRVAGVGGLVFLIICVIGLYYREDIMDMIKE